MAAPTSLPASGDANPRFVPRRRKRVLTLNARSLKDKIAGYDELSKQKNNVPELVVEDEDPAACERDDPHEYWMWLARRIRDKYDEYDGFVILQGIDPMCNTAAILAFLFEKRT